MSVSGAKKKTAQRNVTSRRSAVGRVAPKPSDRTRPHDLCVHSPCGEHGTLDADAVENRKNVSVPTDNIISTDRCVRHNIRFNDLIIIFLRTTERDAHVGCCSGPSAHDPVTVAVSGHRFMQSLAFAVMTIILL